MHLHNSSLHNCKGYGGGGKSAMNVEVEKGLLTLISSDNPGLQVYFNDLDNWSHLDIDSSYIVSNTENLVH